MNVKETIHYYQQQIGSPRLLKQAIFICNPENEPAPSQIALTIAELDSFIKKVTEPRELALAIFLLSRVPTYFSKAERSLNKSDEKPYSDWEADMTIQTLLKRKEFNEFSQEQKRIIKQRFDLLSPDNPGEFYMDKVPNLLRAYAELMNRETKLGKKLRQEFAAYLKRVFLYHQEAKPRIEVGLILAFQQAILQAEIQGKKTCLPEEFDLAEAYEDDDLIQWKEGLKRLGKRKRGVFGDVISTHGSNRSLFFTMHSSVYNRYEYPGGPNEIARALLVGVDTSKMAAMNLGCGPWLLDTRAFFPEGDIVGIDEIDFAKILGKTPWRKRTGPERGDWQLISIDNPIMQATRNLFAESRLQDNGGEITFIRSNYAKKPLPLITHPVVWLSCRSSVWNTSRGISRIHGLRKIFEYPNFVEKAIIEMTGLFYKPVRTIGGVYLQKSGEQCQILGFNTFGSQYQSGRTFNVFLQDRLTDPQIQALRKSESMILIDSTELPGLFNLI